MCISFLSLNPSNLNTPQVLTLLWRISRNHPLLLFSSLIISVPQILLAELAPGVSSTLDFSHLNASSMLCDSKTGTMPYPCLESFQDSPPGWDIFWITYNAFPSQTHSFPALSPHYFLHSQDFHPVSIPDLQNVPPNPQAHFPLCLGHSLFFIDLASSYSYSKPSLWAIALELSGGVLQTCGVRLLHSVSIHGLQVCPPDLSTHSLVPWPISGSTRPEHRT